MRGGGGTIFDKSSRQRKALLSQLYEDQLSCRSCGAPTATRARL